MPEKTSSFQFRILGMDCAEEVAILKREVGPLVGGADRLAFDILNGRMAVAAAAQGVTAAQVMQAVGRTGMRAEVWREVQPGAAEMGFWQRRGRTVLTAVSGLFAALGFAAHVTLAGSVAAALGSEGMGVAEQAVPLAASALYMVGILAGAWYVVPKAWLALRRLRPDMNLLMTIAVLGAVAIGEWFEAAVVAFLFALSLALESWSVGRARRAVEALMAIAPPTVRVLRDGREAEVSPADVLVGERFLARPGERIALDGVVVRGTSDVNQAPITGESVPVPKEAGAQVFAGTVNGNGALEVETTRLAGETRLAQIIRMVGEAQSRRAPSEQWVDRFAQVYTPAILGVALLVALVPPLVLGGAWGDWLYRALVLLVIGCPCALVISTPVSIVASLAAAARNGVLVKGGVHMETPARLQAVALDKTGTLTEGRPSVVEVVPLNGHTEQELLERVGAMEAHSDHPLARAITEHVRTSGITPAPAEDFQTIPGKGATARFQGKAYWLGSHRYLEERGQETPAVHERLEALSRSGRTVVVVGTEEHVCGFVALADTVRPEARAAVEALHQASVRHVVMLTGDNQGTAEAIARATGVDEVRAELLPGDKVTAVEQLVRDYGTVAMIGDGINDAPALGRATLGIAMGAAGTDAAIEAGDVALMSDDLSKLPWLVRHSRRTLAIIRQNVALSLGVKLVFVALTFLGHATLWAAIAADMGVSLVVIANALRLLGARAAAPAHRVLVLLAMGITAPCLVAQEPPSQPTPATVTPILPGRSVPVDETFQWRPALTESMRFLLIEHGFRMAFQPGTRRRLGGPFLRDWAESVRATGGWGDGDNWFLNYVGHPMQGTMSGYIQVQNDPRGRLQEFGRAPAYWKSRLKALAWNTAYSVQFEVGPISESSLGNVGQRKGTSGYVDHVMTPVGGLGWMLAEDALDRHLVRRLEALTDSPRWRVFYRVTLNPSRSFANVLRGRKPWHRDTRSWR